MNFDFSDDLRELQSIASKMLLERDAVSAARRALDDGSGFDTALWQEIGRLGWIGAAIPEEYGGSGIGYEALCLLSEELGRCVAPVPFSSSVTAAQALLLWGTDEQKKAWLPAIADGSKVGTFALVEKIGNPSSQDICTTVVDGKIYGSKLAVPDGEIADMAIAFAAIEKGHMGFVLVDLAQPSVSRTKTNTIDPVRNHANLAFDGAACEPMASNGWADVMSLLSLSAVLVAFEQIGGAQACLTMAQEHALERFAFGRPIGSYQAIKHKLAQLFIQIELARSNAYYAAWGATHLPPSDLLTAAATARVSATEAFRLAAKENIQTHGGMGFTWESDCHLYYRRANLLALSLGSTSFWTKSLIAQLAGPSQAGGRADGF